MNVRMKCLWILLLLPASGRAQTFASAPLTDLGAIQVRSIRIAEVSPQGISLSVDLTLTATRSVTVDSVRLSALRMNGLPLFAAPLTTPLELAKDKPVGVPPLVIKALFRDLNSVAPLRKMLEEENVQVQGQAQAVLRVGFLEKLALHTEHPIISIPINQNVPVAVGGPPFARQAALGVLTLVESALEAASAAGNHLPGLETAWVKALKAKAPGALVEMETHYALTENNISYPVVLDQLGFRLDGAPLLTTPEVKTPWEYDPEFLGRIHSGEAKLETNATDIQVVPLSTDADSTGAGALLLSRGDFTLQERGSAEQDKMLVQAKGVVSVKVKRRASPNALLLLVPNQAQQGQSFSAAPDDIVHLDHWEKVAVFHLLPATSGTAPAKPVVELIQLSAHREGKFIRFEQPVDAAAFGSPVITPEGVLGIVQDETTGAFLPADLARTHAPL